MNDLVIVRNLQTSYALFIVVPFFVGFGYKYSGVSRVLSPPLWHIQSTFGKSGQTPAT